MDIILYCTLFMSKTFFFFKQKTAYELRISDWSSDVCSSDLTQDRPGGTAFGKHLVPGFPAVPVRRVQTKTSARESSPDSEKIMAEDGCQGQGRSAETGLLTRGK